MCEVVTYPAATDTAATRGPSMDLLGTVLDKMCFLQPAFATGLCSLGDPQYHICSLGGNVRPEPEDVVEHNGLGTEA
ncbi:hypothetical protein GJ744_003686 [Endocarpon pusillum]|uniref:Uncharacterized protein n=1 Tax=Endocarpon pusillum TaxID=364733 RepID=A0A8H7AE08_9EURO|nr:hypothetical protein GJ744_003686 [Endocarpon pusillum]